MRRNTVDERAKDIGEKMFIRISKRVARCGGGGGCTSEKHDDCSEIQQIRIFFITKSKIVWILWINKFEIGEIVFGKKVKEIEGIWRDIELRQWTIAEKE